MPTKKAVKHTQDRKELAAKEKYEVAAITRKYKGLTQKVVREVRAKVGKSQKKVNDYLLGALVLWIALVTAKHAIEKEEEDNYKNIV